MRRLTLFISALLLSWLAVVSFKAEIESAFSTWSLHRANHRGGRRDNPLYEAMNVVARQYNLDVSSARRAARTRVIDLANDEIFTKPPGYYDVIIFGDSSLVWSFSPQLVAQASGKKVVFLGFESALPNKSFVSFAEQMSNLYLKRGGSAVFLFDLWWVSPDEPQRTSDLLKMTQRSDGSVRRQELERAVDSIFSLPRLAVYGEAVEPFFAPERYRQKHYGAQGLGCAFYSWGAHSDALFLHCASDDGEPAPAQAQTFEVGKTIVEDCSGAGAGNMAANLTALANANIAHKAIAVPLGVFPQRNLVCETRKLKGQLELLDLPRLAFERHGIKTLEAQGATHLANTSSIPASFVLGRALANPR